MDLSKKPKATKIFLYSIMIGFMVVGTAGKLINKYLDNMTAPKLPPGEGCYNFSHPYLQSTFYVCRWILMFYIFSNKNKTWWM